MIRPSLNIPIFASSSISMADSYLSDVYLWRRKEVSITVVGVATAIWVLLEVYLYNLLTVVSWVAMLIITLLFLYGNMLKLFGKEAPDMSGLEIIESQTMVMASSLRGGVEETVRWAFRVSAEREWFVFSATVVGLLLLSYVASLTDFLTIFYTGLMLGMTAPVTYVHYEDKFKSASEWVMLKLRKCYEIVDHKVIRNIMHKVVKEKDKKVE